MVDRRVAGLPLEQVLGWAEFCGLRIAVDPGVFVPRRRTEFLVRQALSPLARPGGTSSSTCAAARARSAPRWPPRWTGPSCTPPTSTRPPCAAPGATVGSAARSTRATCTIRCPPGCAAGSPSWSPTRPTCRPGRSACCRPRPGCTSRASRSTAAPDGLDILRRVAAGAPGLAGARRPPADRDQRAPGPAGRAAFAANGLTARVAILRRPERHRRHRHHLGAPGLQNPGKIGRSSSRSTPETWHGGVWAGSRRP